MKKYKKYNRKTKLKSNYNAVVQERTTTLEYEVINIYK